MNALKTLFFSILMISTAYGRTIVLNKTTPIYGENRRGMVEELGTFMAGTSIVLYNDRNRVAGLGPSILVKRINNPDRINSNYRYQLALDINRTSHFENFYISARDLQERRDTRPVIVSPRRDNPRRDVVVTPRVDYGHEYQVCYETPRSRVVTMNREQQKRGNRNVVGGIIGAIGGQVIGGITGNDRLGDVISAVGIGFAAVGAVQVASSKEVFYTNSQIDCQRYYQPDTRVYTFRRQGQRCSTTRYYTNRWGNENEYFETVCTGRQTSRYVTFERSYEIYAY